MTTWVSVARKGSSMFTQDYLMRMFLMLAGAIRESLQRAHGDDDPRAAAELLDASLEDATEMDGSLLLRMTPESMAAMLQLSQPDPQLMGYVSRTLLLSSTYLKQAGDESAAALRRAQALAVSDAFDLGISDASVEPEQLESFLSQAEVEAGSSEELGQ